MASSDVAYAAAVLAIYLALAIPAVYATFKHGFKALAWLGWVYFMLFCTLRIVGSALQIASPASTGAAIISSVGLSPLTIATGGVLHEARHYLLSLDCYAEKRQLDLVFVLLFHAAVAAATGLLASGASSLQSATTQASPSKLATAWHLAGIGALVLLSALTLVFLGASYTYLCHKPETQQQRLAQRMVVAVAVACPLLAVRVFGSVVFYISEKLEMSPVNGSWGFRVGLYLVPEVLAACTLLAGGLVARNVKGENAAESEFEHGQKFGSQGS